MAVYTGNDSAYASYPCTFDGESTFSFYLIYYVSSGYFAQGTEKLVFDTDIDTTPVVEIAFEGIETTSTGFKAPKLHFSPNEYTKYYKAAVVAGDITAAMPYRSMINIINFIQAVDHVVPGFASIETLLYSPELKFYSNRVKMDTDFNTSVKGLHCLGDSSGWTRGLMMASVMGVLMGRVIAREG